MKRMSVFAGVVLLALSTAAQASDAIANWSAPLSWTAPSTQATGRSALVTLYPPLPFIPLSPCRLADIRAGSGFPAGYGPPAIVSGGVRNFVITGQCGIPALAQAVSFNFAVWAPTTRGDLRAYPAGASPVPVVSTLNWEAGILALANAAVVPLGTAGAITVKNDGTTPLEIFIDVNGYYTTFVGGSSFIVASTSALGISGTSTTGFGVEGIGGTAGVFGLNDGGAPGFGVFGQGLLGIGVWGNSTGPGNAGVLGTNNGTGTVFGVQGRINGTAAAGAAGVHGIGAATAGATSGVLGESFSGAFNSAGVTGFDLFTALPLGTNALRAGVFGASKAQIGVEGLSEPGGAGVRGEIFTPAGSLLAIGLLGFQSTLVNYGVWASGAMHATGAITGASKSFVQPHPLDASREINYISLEGPAAEIYFRGSISVPRGMTRIEIPEHFRLVSRPGSYSAIVSPVGRLATVAVIEEGEDGIVVEASRDVRINYVVYAEREAFKEHVPVTANIHFVPDSEKGLLGTPDSYRQILIGNGTLNPDGTTNLQTAERLGWKRVWEEKAAAEAAAHAAAGQAPEPADLRK